MIDKSCNATASEAGKIGIYRRWLTVGLWCLCPLLLSGQWVDRPCVATEPSGRQHKPRWVQSLSTETEDPAAGSAQGTQTAQQPGGGRSSRGRWRFFEQYGKNHTGVKDAFLDVSKQAWAATVRVLADGDAVALGTVVSADGYIVSKASLLDGALMCRLQDGSELEANVVGTDEKHDLALLKVASDDLTAVAWRDDNPPPGALIAAIGTNDQPLAVGIVSTELRAIAGPARAPSQRGWLGISLAAGESGPRITDVMDDSAAAQAGLKEDDLIVNIRGTAMKSIEQVVETVGSHAPGEALALLVRRGEKDIEVSAKLGKRPDGPEPQDNWGGGPFSERRTGFPVALPHDAIVPPDQCGGPLVDTDGKVVGVNIARALRVSTYALPARTVQELLEALRAGQSEEE